MPHRLISVARATGLLLALLAATASAVGGLSWLTAGLLNAVVVDGVTLDELVGLIAVLGCWLCVGWLALAMACTVAAVAPGAIGRWCAAAADVLAPWTLRNLVVAGLGLSVLAGPAAAASGFAPTVGLDQATESARDRRVGQARFAHDLPPLDRPADGAQVVTVQPGDSLWSIAARVLGAHATDADIAAAWPRWYAANRDVVGPDPNLLLPGQQLAPPPYA